MNKKELFYLVALSIISLLVLILMTFCTYFIIKDAKESLSDDLRLINQNQVVINQKLDTIIDYLNDWEVIE